jgi:hypothetical protein
VLGVLLAVLNDVQSADHFVGLREVAAPVAVQLQLEFLDLLQLFKRVFEAVRLEVQQTDVALDFASSLVDLAVVVLEDLLSLLQAIQGLVELLAGLLHLGQVDENARDDVRVRKLVNLVEHREGLRLVLDRFVDLFRL